MGRKAAMVILGALMCASRAFAQGEAPLAQGDIRSSQGEIQLYGRVDMDIERVWATGSTAVAGTPPVPGGYDKPPRERVSSNSSYLGVRGATHIREGLDGFFQIESGLNQDTGTATTTTSSSTGISGTFASRNSALGLKGDLGRLFLGTWETPYRMGFVVLDPFGYTGIGGFSVLGNGHTTNPNAGNLVSFGRRQNNSVQYWSPTRDGFRLRLAYSPNEERPATGTVTAAMPAGYNPSLYSASLTYALPQLYGYLGYERHQGYTSVGQNDFGVNAGGSYSVGPLKFGALFEQLHYRFGGAAQNVAELFNSYFLAGAVAAGATGELKIASWGTFASYDMGAAGHLRAAYEHAGDATGSALIPGARTGASKTTLGYGYTLSSQAEAYVVWTRINNHANGVYDFTTNLIGTAPTGGAHPTGFGVGMSYVF